MVSIAEVRDRKAAAVAPRRQKNSPVSPSSFEKSIDEAGSMPASKSVSDTIDNLNSQSSVTTARILATVATRP